MTFHEYMAKNFGHFDLSAGVMSVNGEWLKRFWIAAQNALVNETLASIRGANPCKLNVITGKEAAELMRDEKLRVWLDDVRPMPKGETYDIHVKTAEEAIALIESGSVGFMSFDHDLGFDPKTMMCAHDAKSGYDVAKVAERLAAEGRIDAFGWKVHSMNPTGADNIERAMKKADEFWGVSH